ncbi:MAG: hypothetical protein P4M12_01845 [Gammaproteobacteria bacterium]|nr:hypothetical protein [Gammaproteobacteria bacterium]
MEIPSFEFPSDIPLRWDLETVELLIFFDFSAPSFLSIPSLKVTIALCNKVQNLTFLIERKANRYFFAAYGMKGILATAWLGTPIHELGHALMCLIFAHKIKDIKLLTLNQADGTLGYVSHS